MKGGITAVKNIRYDRLRNMSRQQLMDRTRQVIERELTPLQRETLLAYYFQEMNISQIAQERGVHKSTVCRTLHRAEDKLKRFLKY